MGGGVEEGEESLWGWRGDGGGGESGSGWLGGLIDSHSFMNLFLCKRFRGSVNLCAGSQHGVCCVRS